MAKRTEEQQKASKDKKAAKLQAQEESRIASNLEYNLEQLRLEPLPEPKYIYKAGDVVKPRTAHWNSLTITEILDNGKIFKCKVDYTDENYGHPVKKSRVQYVSHLDILPADLKLAPTMSKRDERTISFNNCELSSLLHYHYRGLDYSPVYQRELCWTQADKESLINSIFNNVEIGKFAIIEKPYDKNEKNGYEVLDGKQRLSTLVEFYEDKFPYNGIYFSELSHKDKGHFLHYNATLGRGNENMTLTQKMSYFLRMNVGGVPQDPAHLEKVKQMLEKESK